MSWKKVHERYWDLSEEEKYKKSKSNMKKIKLLHKQRLNDVFG